jgi:Eco57I restriction-modification methylase
MAHPRTAYELSNSQVATPSQVISLFWRLTKQYRHRLGSVLDMGAGDCRFARGGIFDQYTGIEIDKGRVAVASPPANGKIIHGCVFRHDGSGYSACIGNPPYVRHHDIESPWKENTVARLERQLDIPLNKHGNLYLYFFCLGLLKSNEDGLVALVIPYEWVSRPSFKAVREYIQRQNWHVAVYSFQMPVFEGVMTTASITIVDKACRDNQWKYFDITPDYQAVPRHGITGSKERILDYSTRGETWALRGLSPGSQKVFTLTEGERIRSGLSKRDVVPCVTSLRHVPPELRVLSRPAFDKHFVKAGRKCWLIRSNETERSIQLNTYLESIPEAKRQTYTCKNQTPWFNYESHPVPQLLFGSAFTKFGPKILINSMGVHAVGSVYGIHSKKKLPVRHSQGYLLEIDFEKRVVAHSGKLKKVEIKQLNAVLNAFSSQKQKNTRNRSR